jgi:hypothetical protein
VDAKSLCAQKIIFLLRWSVAVPHAIIDSYWLGSVSYLKVVIIIKYEEGFSYLVLFVVCR